MVVVVVVGGEVLAGRAPAPYSHAKRSISARPVVQAARGRFLAFKNTPAAYRTTAGRATLRHATGRRGT